LNLTGAPIIVDPYKSLLTFKSFITLLVSFISAKESRVDVAHILNSGLVLVFGEASMLAAISIYLNLFLVVFYSECIERTQHKVELLQLLKS